jgi:hypothetical protein
MSEQDPTYITAPIEEADVKSGFSCGKHPLDDYFVRHALANERRGIGRAFVLRRAPADDAELPAVLGFYTLSMASAESAQVAAALKERLALPMPVALIGRLAIDTRAQGRRLGEKLLVDALRRIVDAARSVACTGIIVDARGRRAVLREVRLRNGGCGELATPHVPAHRDRARVARRVGRAPRARPSRRAPVVAAGEDQCIV